MARTERRLEITDGAVLAAMAHPLRVALLYQLNALGRARPASAPRRWGRRRPTAATTFASWPRWDW